MPWVIFTILILYGISASGLTLAQLDSRSASSNIFDNAPLNTNALQSLLPAESAFSLNGYIETPNTIVLNWQIEEGYYLYRDSLQFTPLGDENMASPQIPAGVSHQDEFFGDVEVYYQQLLVRIPFDPNTLESSITLNLNYQGCAEERYCYPMQTQQITLDVLETTAQ
jgi:thiol:disulfide interchange protein DsbD